MKNSEMAMKAEDILNRIPTLDSSLCSQDEESEIPVKVQKNIPKGKPKSGRIWKGERKR